jgi:UDP-glucose 4-epimerase
LADRPADVPRLWVKADKFYKLTNFRPKYSFEQGMIETVAYYKHKVLHKNLLKDIQVNNWIKDTED